MKKAVTQDQSNKIRATSMAIGETITGVLAGFKENKYGKQNILLTVDGEEVEIMIAGNLQFLAQDVIDGKRFLGEVTSITRQADRSYKGKPITNFKVTQEKGSVQAVESTMVPAASAPAVVPAPKSVKEQLEEIRARKAAQQSHGQNA